MESLIKCGAFDNISDNRASLMMGYEKLLDSVEETVDNISIVVYSLLCLNSISIDSNITFDNDEKIMMGLVVDF